MQTGINLELLYKIISAFRPSVKEHQDSWQSFIDSTYGSFLDEPIEKFTYNIKRNKSC